MPHSMRWILYVAHPGLSARKLHRTIEARPGMRVLEIGPGVGHHALPTARRLAPGGQLDALDIQPEMLRDLQRRAQAQGVDNVVTQVGDALRLPYADATFDAAYLITVLGEIPQPDAALRELARVLKPGGTIAVGEIFLDPDYVSPTRMRQLAQAAGLSFEAQVGTSLAFFACLRHADR
jgi:ubiquinone/menaquinone biosynthesis C-methylase UbiE